MLAVFHLRANQHHVTHLLRYIYAYVYGRFRLVCLII